MSAHALESADASMAKPGYFCAAAQQKNQP
jgi:hypothetical protein